MFKNIISKLTIVTLQLGIIFGTVAMVPAIAQAKENNHDDHDQWENVDFKIHDKANFGFGNLGLGNIDFNIAGSVTPGNGSLIKDIIKPAQKTFKQAVKDANTTYKTSKKTAKEQLKTSISTTTNQADRISAVKTYFNSVLAAFKVKSAAVEVAFQAFINSF